MKLSDDEALDRVLTMPGALPRGLVLSPGLYERIRLAHERMNPKPEPMPPGMNRKRRRAWKAAHR